jgi:hypothetical protein
LNEQKPFINVVGLRYEHTFLARCPDDPSINLLISSCPTVSRGTPHALKQVGPDAGDEAGEFLLSRGFDVPANRNDMDIEAWERGALVEAE